MSKKARDSSLRREINAMAKVAHDSHLRGASALLKEHQRDRDEFRRAIRRVWGKPLDMLAELIVRCSRLGAEVRSGKKLDLRQQALVVLWARGCQVSFAIHTLLEAGFADDAHGRWRTLHELNVVAQFLRDRNGAISERYFATVDVKNYKVSLEYQRCAPDLKYRSIAPSVLARLKRKSDAAIAKFPNLGHGEWAWAAPEFPAKDPRRIGLFDLERAVGLSKWRAHVGMAHHNVHAGAHGALFRLGSSKRGKGTVAIAGPSLSGLADPGHACAISLWQLTLQVTLPQSDQDVITPQTVSVAKALGSLVDACGREFKAATVELRRPPGTE